MKSCVQARTRAVLTGVAILWIAPGFSAQAPPGYPQIQSSALSATAAAVPLDQQVRTLQSQVAALQAQVGALLAAVQVTQTGVVLQGPSVTIAGNAVTLTTQGNMELRAGNFSVSARTSPLLPSGGSIKFTSDAAVDVHAAGNITALSSSSMTLRAGSTSEVSASGNLDLRGSTTHINGGSKPAARLGSVVNASSGQVVTGSPSVFVD